MKSEETVANQPTHFDAVVIGAGFSGLYMLYRLREAGFSARVFEAGDGVGGVWYWNRYPGAKCDTESITYNYTFSEELFKEWTWSARYAPQPEILRYLNFVADKFDLRREIQFNTRIMSAHYDEEENLWWIHKEDGTSVSAKYFITGLGCLSAANLPNFKGLEDFKGEWYHTGKWPHEKVEFQGKRVGVIGTGSSGVQAIPFIAEEAEHLTVFQRTPAYCLPARNHALKPDFVQQVKDDFHDLKKRMHECWFGHGKMQRNVSALEETPEERRKIYEAAWETGGPAFQITYNDLLRNEESNKTIADFLRSKILETVKDPNVAKKLLPDFFYGTKRPIYDSDYYETYNRDNVHLVDLREERILEITPKGLRTEKAEYELDILVFATGYDAMTGPLMKIDIRGKDGVSLKEKWEQGAQVRTYLGIANAGFPNMFMITGPESPSVASNMPVAIEQHVDWIEDCLCYLREMDVETIEAKADAENAWSKHCKEVAETTLYPKTKSWYTGGNIDGKPRGFLIYVGGFYKYRQKCDEVAAKGYEGFSLKLSTKTVPVEIEQKL